MQKSEVGIGRSPHQWGNKDGSGTLAPPAAFKSLCRETHTSAGRTKPPQSCLMINDLLSGLQSVGYPA